MNDSKGQSKLDYPKLSIIKYQLSTLLSLSLKIIYPPTAIKMRGQNLPKSKSGSHSSKRKIVPRAIKMIPHTLLESFFMFVSVSLKDESVVALASIEEAVCQECCTGNDAHKII